jgi:ubiquinone/menaquinone biosynthesis C-methylase UbiE
MSFCGGNQPRYSIPLPEKLFSFLKDRTLEKVLDVGCGYGRACFFLQEKGCNVVGVDVDKAQIRMALKEAKERSISQKTSLVVNDASNLCLQDSSFDAVTMLGLLTLIPKQRRQKILDEAWRVLRPSGFLFIEEFGRTWQNPVYASRYKDDFEVTREKGTFTLKDEHDNVIHLAHHFSRKELLTLLKKFRTLSFEEVMFTSYYHKNWVRGFIILLQKQE